MDANKTETMKALALAKELRFFGRFATETEDQARARRHKERSDAADALEVLSTEVERLRAELAAGAACEGGNTSESTGQLDHAKTAETRMNSGFEGGYLGSAPAAGTVEKDASQRVGKRIHNIWEDAQIAWGDACGGPPAYEIFAYSLISAMQEESAAMAHTKGKDAA